MCLIEIFVWNFSDCNRLKKVPKEVELIIEKCVQADHRVSAGIIQNQLNNYHIHLSRATIALLMNRLKFHIPNN